MRLVWGVALLLGLSPVCSHAQSPLTPVLSAGQRNNTHSQGATTDNSPSLERIRAAKQAIQAHPERAQGHNDLALAYLRRARETADPSYYKDAEYALNSGLNLEPNNFQLQKARVALLLGQHEFAQARHLAQALNKSVPDDVTVYGYLATADLELGDYAEAETAAQWMLNLRRDNIPGLLIGSQLRTLYGDSEGALEFLNQSYRETSQTETEELAWIANQIAAIEISSGKLDNADQVLQQAEKLSPGYPLSRQNLAKLRMAQGRYQDAAEILQDGKLLLPANLYLRAEALEKAGQAGPAETAYAEFERVARGQMNAADNANRELILYDVDHAKNQAEALSIAACEIAARHDVMTLDAYAWALYGNGKYSEARVQMDKALAVGIRDAQLFYHAGRIDSKLNISGQAARDFESSLQVNPYSEFAADARRLAGSPTPTSGPPVVKQQVPAVDFHTAPMLSSPATLADLARMPVSVKPNTASLTLPAQPFQPVPRSLQLPRATGTDRLIRSMQAQVVRGPKEPAGYAGLGAAFFQKARETGDVSYYELSEKALNKSLDLSSDDLSATAATLTLAEVCMGEHRFTEALAYAQRSLSLGSGDVSPFAIVGDAYTDMGEYDKAAVAYLKLQQPADQARIGGSYARDSRISYLKFLSGDTSAAIALLQNAVDAGNQAQLPSENRAWLYYELGEYYFQAGNAGQADRSYFAALTIHPGDYRALAGMGRIRANQGRYAEAIELYQKAIAVVPMPIYVGELADLYTKVGRTADAAKQSQLVEYIGRLGNINKVLHNRDLALFYADHNLKLKESLRLARKEFEVRHDIYTWDALAWSLYKNGMLKEAADANSQAMRLHTKDAILFFHAGMIYQGLGEDSRAADYFRQAVAINPHFHVLYSDVARQQLAKLEKQSMQSARGMSHVQ